MRAAALLAVLLAGCVPSAVVAPLLPSYRDAAVPIASKADLDPARFAGLWHEVARYPVRFQRGCAGATATYGAPRDGRLSVLNACLDAAGRATRTIAGEARVVGPGRLEVRLDGVPFVAPYWVLWTAQDYGTAVVATPDGRAAWVLNRSATISPERSRVALEVLAFNGFDTGLLTGPAVLD